MKRRGKKALQNARALRLWTYDEAARAVPYLRSVIGSLREHWLDAHNQRRRFELLSAHPGRPDRARMIASAALAADRDSAESSFNDAVDELAHLDVYLLDPVRGVALIPFRKEDDLAWYVFDQFDEHGLSGWRLHSDPLEKCRPLEMKESLN